MKSQLKVTSVDKIKWNIFITQLIKPLLSFIQN